LPTGRFFIQTFGCQMNEADSQAMGRLLEAHGWAQANTPEEAALIILNTCCVRAKPEEKVYSRLGELRPLKERDPSVLLVVAGCMAQKEGEKMLKRVPYLDLVLGTRQFHRLPEFVLACQAGERLSVLGLEDDPFVARHQLAADGQAAGLKVFVPIILGCDNRCTYCIVPSVRGEQKSRPAAEILAEVAALAERGCKEITLLGQNVLAYGRDLPEPTDFARLLEILHEVAGLARIRFTTAHPRDVDDHLIQTAAALPKVCEHWHLPVQAGEDQLLRAMGRGYTAAEYAAKIEKIRAARPGAAITTDIMVGFPGETDEQFETSLEFYEKIGFDQAFTFVYSTRPGTPAAKMAEQVAKAVKVKRLIRLSEAVNQSAIRINTAAVSSVGEVLVEGLSEKDAANLGGRLRNNKFVVFPGSSELIGQFVKVKLISAHPWGFMGDVADR
jgi:tRNA-2-methylthio-N6-dimethylallyladenosine synthase